MNGSLQTWYTCLALDGRAPLQCALLAVDKVIATLAHVQTPLTVRAETLPVALAALARLALAAVVIAPLAVHGGVGGRGR